MHQPIGRRSFIGGLTAAAGIAPLRAAEPQARGRTAVARGTGVTGRNTFAEVETANPEMAIFTLSAIEQHGEVLPVGTDYFTISAVVKEIGKRLNVYVLPTMPVGTSREHLMNHGTITLQHETLRAYVRDIITSLYRQGFRYVTYMTGHGGNFIVESTLEELNREYPDRTCIWIQPKSAPGIMENQQPDIHAGEGEVSSGLYLFPEDTHRENSVDTEPPAGRELYDFAYVRDFSHSGVWGASSLGTKEKGRLRFENAVDSAVEQILTLFPDIERRKGAR